MTSRHPHRSGALVSESLALGFSHERSSRLSAERVSGRVLLIELDLSQDAKVSRDRVATTIHGALAYEFMPQIADEKRRARSAIARGQRVRLNRAPVHFGW